MNTTSKKKSIEPAIFWGPLVLLAIACTYLVMDPVRGNEVLNKAFGYLTGALGWTYEWYTFGFFVLLIYLVTGKYGDKKLGDDKPEFSTLSWLGMLFTSTMGSSLMYWGTIEFYFYLTSPPYGAEPFSIAAAEWASSYGMYHWGILPNAMYSVLAIAFGYMFFIKKTDVVRPSTACVTVLGERANGWLGKVIDVFFVIGLVAGIGTTLGLGTPLVGELITAVFGFEHNIGLDAIIIILWTVMFATSVYFGLQKGIKVLSDIRLYLMLFVLAFVIGIGPASFMFNNFTDSFGHMMQNFVKMSFYTDPHGQSGFPQGWTIFYWAWYITYALQFGIYLARISKGRTIRQLALGVVCAASFGSWMFFAVFGNYAIDVFNQGIVPIADIMAEHGTARAIVEIWSTVPFSGVMLVVFLVLLFISAATVLNGAAFTLAMVTTKNLTADEEPANWNKVFWALVLGGVSLTLMFLGGLKPLQTSSIIGSFPMMFITIIIMIGCFKEMYAHWGSSDNDNKNVSMDTEKIAS